TLANNGLRPGADASRTRAELALAETQLIRAEEAVDVGRAALAQLLGVSPQTIAVQPEPFRRIPPEQETPGSSPAQHPLAITPHRVVAETKSREKALDRLCSPRFNLQGTAYGRGAGIHADGTVEGGANGLGPNIQNWAVGLTVTFPMFDFA